MIFPYIVVYFKYAIISIEYNVALKDMFAVTVKYTDDIVGIHGESYNTLLSRSCLKEFYEDMSNCDEDAISLSNVTQAIMYDNQEQKQTLLWNT